ncbi:MAG: hypothetical protein ACK2UA_12540 [Anaerolineae bacterium]
MGLLGDATAGVESASSSFAPDPLLTVGVGVGVGGGSVAVDVGVAVSMARLRSWSAA